MKKNAKAKGSAEMRLVLQALVLADAKSVKENCMKFGAGEDLYAFFTSILTMKPWERVIDPAVDHLAINGPSELQVRSHCGNFSFFKIRFYFTVPIF